MGSWHRARADHPGAARREASRSPKKTADYSVEPSTRKFVAWGSRPRPGGRASPLTLVHHHQPWAASFTIWSKEGKINYVNAERAPEARLVTPNPWATLGSHVVASPAGLARRFEGGGISVRSFSHCNA